MLVTPNRQAVAWAHNKVKPYEPEINQSYMFSCSAVIANSFENVAGSHFELLLFPSIKLRMEPDHGNGDFDWMRNLHCHPASPINTFVESSLSSGAV